MFPLDSLFSGNFLFLRDVLADISTKQKDCWMLGDIDRVAKKTSIGDIKKREGKSHVPQE